MANPASNFPESSNTKRIIVAGLNSLVWLIGIFFLHWNIFEVMFIFKLDISLYLLFGGLRVLFSVDNDKSFFQNILIRIFFVAFELIYGLKIISAISGVYMTNEETITYIFNSPNSWTYGVMFLNYCGFFLHDFIYSGKYKVSNPFIEGLADFISLIIITCVISFIINFSPDSKGMVYWLFTSVAIIISRFVFEVFLSLKGRTYLGNNYEIKNK